MWNLGSPEIQRNLGYYRADEQQAMLDSTVALAGVGGEGFELGITLARNGVQHFKVADPEVFERQNINRVPGARRSTVGMNKAEVFAHDVADINADAVVEVYSDGVTPDNVSDFLTGADLAFDGIELRNPEYSVALYREARKQKIPAFMAMNIGFSAIVTSFDPEDKYTFETLMGIPEEATLEEVAQMEIGMHRSVPHLPGYGDLATLLAVQEGAPLPSIGQGVHMSSAMAATQAFLHLTKNIKNNRPKPVWAPRIAVLDAMEPDVIRYPRLHHYGGLASIIIGAKLKRTPQASYGNSQSE